MISPKLPTLPLSVTICGRHYFPRAELENYKRALAGLPLLPDDRSPIELVPAKQATRELGITRRTLGRRMAKTSTCAQVD
jgi:hypothetical protein